MIKELKPGMNTGFIAEEPREMDTIAGDGHIAAADLLSDGDWTPFLPSRELQGAVYFDSMACVSFSALNCLEIVGAMLIASGMVPEATIYALREGGWLGEDGKLNFSDRYTAKMSGTRRTGNTMNAVWDSILNDGVLPEGDWSFPREQRQPVFDWDDYYKTIPQELINKAHRFPREFFDLDREWLITGGRATIAQFRTWLRRGPIQVAGPICAPWSVGPVPACGGPVTHATTIYKADSVLRDFDHYDPIQKALAADYPLPYAIRPIMFAKNGLRASPIDLAFAKRLAGQLLLDVDDRGALWYVTPTGKRAKVGNTPDEIEAFLQGIRDGRIEHTGINSANIAKIPTV